MLASRKLRWLGRACAVVGGVGALVTLALAGLFFDAKPLQTVGTHGMLPSDFHSLLFGSVFAILAALCLALLAIGLLCSFGARLARNSALVIGSSALVVGAAFQVYVPAWWGILGSMLAPLVWTPALPFAAYLTALGIASSSESRARSASLEKRWLTRPEPLAGLILGLAVLVNMALRPLTYQGVLERQLSEVRACSSTSDITRYCGRALGVAFVPQDSSLLVLRDGPDGLLLEKYSAVPPRAPTWSRALAGSGETYRVTGSLVVSRDGSIVLVASSKGVERFDGTTGAPLGPIAACGAPGRDAHAAAISPDGKTIAIGKKTVCLFPATSANVEADVQSLEWVDGQVSGLVFAPSGTRLWVQTDKRFAAWDVNTRERVLSSDTQGLRQLAISSDGKRLLTSWDRTAGIELWDAETGALLGQVKPGLLGHGPLDGPLAFLPDGRNIVALANRGYYVLDPLTGGASEQHDTVAPYEAITLSADGRWAAFARQGAAGEPTPTFEFVSPERVLSHP